MATYEITKDGKTFEVEVPEGQDPNVVLAGITGTQSAEAPPAAPPDLVDPSALPGSISEAEALRPAPSVGDQLGSLVEGIFPPAASLTRGVGLGARTVAGAVPRTATGLADLAAGVANVPVAGLDQLGQLMGDEPLDARLPTDSTQSLDLLLDEIFPRAETLPERLTTGAGEVALTGGAGGAALAPKAARVATNPASQSILRNLGDEIGEFFAKSPGKFGALEATGGVGAVGAGEAADAADASPMIRALATLFGGAAGGVAPTAGVNTARRAGAALKNRVPGLAPEHRAASELQSVVADPKAAARAALEAPEGVTPAQAADSPSLRAKENRVLADDPEAEATVAAGRAAAEERSLDELATLFGPGTNSRAWEHSVVSRAAPEGAAVPEGEVDDMVRHTAEAFNTAYRDAEGYPLRSESMNVEGGNIPLKEEILTAAGDPSVLTGDNVRARVASWLDSRYESLVTRGDRVGGTDDAPLYEVDSGDLLALRQVVRKQQRQKAAAGRTSADAQAEAELLSGANRAITRVLESQLPEDAVAALRATDARYKDFKVVEDAVTRSGSKGLTAQALESSLKRSRSPGQVARGETGELGVLAEQGRSAADLLKPSATDAQARRLVRSMTPEQRQAVKADLNAEIAARASQRGKTPIQGAKYSKEIDANESRLRAAGFDDVDINNMRRASRELAMIQSRSSAKVQQLISDDVGVVLRLVAAIAGSAGGQRALRLAGVAGSGPSLILSQFGSKNMQNALKRLQADRADELIREALSGKASVAQSNGKDISSRELFAALMTKPTDSVKAQADAARILNAWLAETGRQAAKAEDE